MRALLSLVTGPAISPVSVEDLKSHLNVTESDWDDEIEACLEDAVAVLDGQGRLGRAICAQTWRQSQPVAPLDGRLRLLIGPVASVSAIDYFDAENQAQTATVGDFILMTEGDFAELLPGPGISWPSGLYDRPDALRITYVAGAASADDVPKPVKRMVKLLAAHYWDNREIVTFDRAHSVPETLESLLNANRTRFYG